MAKNSYIITIPEVQHAIGRSLSRRDLARCILVCRSWHDAFIPLLWRDLNQTDTFNLTRKNCESGIASYGQYIRKLDLHPPEKLDYYHPHCHNLTELSVHEISQPYSGPRTSERAPFVDFIETPASSALDSASKAVARQKPYEVKVEAVVRMVEANPSLTSLALRVHYNVPFAVVYDMIHPVRHNLRRLVVSYHDDPPTQVTSALVRQLLDRCPNLEFLQFRADTMLSLQETHNDWKARLEHWKVMRQQQREPQLVNGRSREGPYKLKDLEISFQRMDQSHLPFIYTLLQLCPNLERIVVPDNPVETLPIFERILQDHLGCLTAIDLTYLGFSEPLEDTRIARILRATKPNQLQKVRTWGQYNEETFRSLAEHQAQSIQVIDMGGYRGHISSRGVQQVLANCPRLKIFKTGGHSPQMGYLLAEDIVQSEWVCKGLEVLEVPIGGVCRFAPGEPCPRHPNEKDPERVCRAVQRAVYRQLGQLEHLQNLDVHMYNYSELKEAQLETLEWSLASGIEETKGLRKLKSLKFFGTNHRIGIPELQWMKEHWPCLTDLSSFDVPQREQVLWLAANWRKLVPYLDEFGNLCI